MKNFKGSYLGVDFGGTSLLVGEVNASGEILSYKKYKTGYLTQRQAALIIQQSIQDYIQTTGWAFSEKPLSMGVGLLGRVDNKNGIWLQIDPKRTEAIELANELTDMFDMPCFIDNDVKSATRAEKIWGCGKESDDFIYLNVGTGIAAGFIVNGQLIRGSHFNAGEVGHTNMGVGIGIRCGCGRIDCVELIAAGIGFDRSARFLQNQVTTKLHIPEDENKRVEVREVYSLFDEGDELCVRLVENASSAIASLIMNLVRVSDPDTVVLGGGIISSDFLYPKILEKLNKTTIRFVKNGVVITKLNPDFIGLIGAAAVAINQ